MAGDQFLNATLEVKRKFIRRKAGEMGLTVTSEYRNDPNSFHGKNRAIDVAGAPAAMARFFRAFEPLAREKKGVRELFYDPVGAWDNFQRIPPVGGHSDHVHIAFDPPPTSS
ncbi:hypothetical protein SAMN04487846_0005 [Microbacterium sp. cf046]|uniref:hypothetical protein n=1 Tax=Microbacterium sp. cf046 TaxID=1761803 RepID=UPI0008EB3CD5|nr:hypothetical protein [Microbacterium sp. cf046]SFR85636.1 hypothetical protein SAMN04487846_0005 [Microbacterium sp. cf046]